MFRSSCFSVDGDLGRGGNNKTHPPPIIRGQGGGRGEYPPPDVPKKAPQSTKKFIYYCSPPGRRKRPKFLIFILKKCKKKVGFGGKFKKWLKINSPPHSPPWRSNLFTNPTQPPLPPEGSKTTHPPDQNFPNPPPQMANPSPTYAPN